MDQPLCDMWIDREDLSDRIYIFDSCAGAGQACRSRGKASIGRQAAQVIFGATFCFDLTLWV